MQQNLMHLEVALNNLEMRMKLFQVAINNNPENYSGSFKLAQCLILDEFFPAMDEVREELEKVKNEEELVNVQAIKSA